MMRLACLMVSLFAVGLAEDFVPARTHLLDVHAFNSTSSNFLFRGNNPSVNGSFAVDELRQAFATVAKAEGNVAMPPTYQIADYSFLVSLKHSEAEDLKIEEDFFKANPSLGHVTNWPIITDLLGPCLDPDYQKKAASGHWDLDDVPNKINTLRELLMTPSDPPTVIYIHCEAGVDRTGEVSGAYNMQFNNQTFAQALAFNNNVEPRAMSSESENGMKWYSFYLEYAKGINPGFKC